MKFGELNKEEFTTFLENHPLRTFFQTVEMEQIGARENWQSYYVGVKENNNVIAATRMMSKPVHFKKKIFYAPRGVLVDYNNTKLLEFFIKNIKSYIKKKGGYTFHIDPPVIYKERDINGDLVKDGIDNSNVVEELKRLGFHHDGFIRHYDPTKQVRWSFELPVINKTKEEVLKQMNGNTRRAISKAEHLKVTTRELKKEELPLFKEIMLHTSERREFTDKDLGYYEAMYDLFHKDGKVKYVIAEVNLNDSLAVIKSDIKILNKQKENATVHHKEAKLREINTQIANLVKKQKELENIKKEKGDIISLACGMFMIYGKDILYYHAGSNKEYMNFFGQYLIQWEMIKEAINLKKECYNFYGIKGNFDKNDKDYGVYLFKKGFNGHVIEYIGDFYLPVSGYYYLQNLKNKLRKGGRN